LGSELQLQGMLQFQMPSVANVQLLSASGRRLLRFKGCDVAIRVPSLADRGTLLALLQLWCKGLASLTPPFQAWIHCAGCVEYKHLKIFIGLYELR
jgi:hypothetical protein